MRRRPTNRRALATVLFTDIVTSTETAARVGDRRWRELLREHHAAVRKALRAHDGREVDTAGDGFFAVFDQPGAAIDCAVAARQAVARLGLRIRAGIHTGEVEPMGAKVGGMAVHLGARVLASCEPGQIRVTSTVRDLVTGSHLAFVDVGTHELKGVPGEWHLFALAGEAPTPAAIADSAAPHGEPPSRRRFVLMGAGGALAIAALAAVAIFLLRPATSAVAASANSIIRIDGRTTTVVQGIGVGGPPSDLATDGADLWLVSETARTLTHVHLPSGEQQPTGLDGLPSDVAVAGGTVYVAEQFEHSLQRISAASGVAAAPIQGPILRAVAFEARDGWGVDPVHDAVIHLPAAGALVAIPLPGGSGPVDVAIASRRVWIANAIGRTITSIDRQTGVPASPINVVDQPSALTATASAVWVISEIGDSLTRIDVDPNRVGTRLGVCDAPVDVVASATDVWVACAGSHEVVRVDLAGKVVARVQLAVAPSAMAIIGDQVWVALRAS